PAPKVATSRQFPFRLNTGRVRDQWHTMTRSGQSARLATHRPEPFVELHPADAKAMRLAEGGFARVATRWGACVLKVAISEEHRRGSLFAPIHWSDATASAARVGDLVMPETVRYSGQPDAKATPASIAPVRLPSAALPSRATRSARRTARGGRAWRLPAHRACCWRRTTDPRSGKAARGRCWAESLRNMWTGSAALTARPRLRPASSRAASSSAPPR